MSHKNSKGPRILLLDIETAPITGYVWATYDTNVLKILEPSKVLSVAWKWLNEDETFCKTIADYKGYKKGVVDDEKLIKQAWDLLDECDVCVAHHGKAFDLKKLNARFVWYKLPAPSSYAVVDTKASASRHFKFDSNSLDNLGQYLNLGSKAATGGFSLWVDCIAGDKDAWARMAEYNIQDVVLLEKVYLALRPYISNHPNLSLLSGEVKDEMSCPTCQSGSVVKRGFSVTRTGKKQRYQCQSCGSWSSGKFEKSSLKSTLVNDET